MIRLLLAGVPMAELEGGVWTSEEPGFADFLSRIRDPWGPPGSHPDPDLWLVEDTARRLGPDWTADPVTRPPFDPAVVY